MNITKEVVWMQFATAALEACLAIQVPDVVAFSSSMADHMTNEWEVRFGDASFLLEGQSECGNCHVPIAPGAPFVGSLDGVKFCGTPCLKASGREE